jgi:hypothetical protein
VQVANHLERLRGKTEPRSTASQVVVIELRRHQLRYVLRTVVNTQATKVGEQHRSVNGNLKLNNP